MVEARFLFQSPQRIVGVSLSGHAMSEKKGRDLVCAALSAQVAMLELGVLHYDAKVKMEKSSGCFSLLYPSTNEAQILLQSFYWALLALEKEYTNYIRTKEVFELEALWQQKKVVDRVRTVAIANPNG